MKSCLRLALISIAVCLLVVLGLSSQAEAKGAGTIKLKVKDGGGGVICATKDEKVTEQQMMKGECAGAPKRNGTRYTIKKVPAGRWFIHIGGGVGDHVCYDKNGGDGRKNCTKVRVKAGETTRVRWDVPTYGRVATAATGQVKASVTIYASKGGTVSGNIKSKTNAGCAFGKKVTLYKAKGQKPKPNKDKRIAKTTVEGSDAGSFYRFDGLKAGLSVYVVSPETKDCTSATSKIIRTK